MAAAAIVAAATGLALAGETPPSPAVYAGSLDRVYDSILAVRFVRDICAETWPALAEANAAAYERWRMRYGPFLREIERAHDDRLQEERRRDPAGHAERMRRWEESDQRFRDTLAAQLLIDGLESFEGECRTYPAYLASPRADLEKVFADRVATIRRGRPKGAR